MQQTHSKLISVDMLGGRESGGEPSMAPWAGASDPSDVLPDIY